MSNAIDSSVSPLHTGPSTAETEFWDSLFALVTTIKIPLEDDGTIEEHLIDFIPIPDGKNKRSTTVEERLGLSIDDIFDRIDEDDGVTDDKVTGQEVLNFLNTQNQLAGGQDSSPAENARYEAAIRAITRANADTPIEDIELNKAQFKSVLNFLESLTFINEFDFTDSERSGLDYDQTTNQYSVTDAHGTFTWERLPFDEGGGVNPETLTWTPAAAET